MWDKKLQECGKAWSLKKEDESMLSGFNWLQLRTNGYSCDNSNKPSVSK